MSVAHRFMSLMGCRHDDWPSPLNLLIFSIMKTSLQWLNRYLDKPIEAQELERLLTSQGLVIEAAQQVAVAQVLADAVDQMAEHGIAGLVAKFVVDTLEMVGVDHNQGDRLAAMLHAREQGAGLLVQAAAVQGVGQPVAFG